MAIPTISGSNFTDIQPTYAVGLIHLASTGGKTITQKGCVYSLTEETPTLQNSLFTQEGGGGSDNTYFGAVIGYNNNLGEYKVRGYATNADGTGYGTIVGFGTYVQSPKNLRIVSNTSNSATLNWENQSSNDFIVLWKSVNDGTPFFYDNIDANDTGYTHTGLNTGTKYTFWVGSGEQSTGYRAYTTPVSITINVGVATVISDSITNITTTTATGGGNITYNGGTAVTARGVCWSTGSTPTISNAHTHNGSGDGVFTSSITGLTAGTTYYVRAYATNSSGTGYGNTVSFVAEYSTLYAGAVGDSQTGCIGSAISLLTTLVAPTGGTGSYSYQWQGGIGNYNTNLPNATGTTYQPATFPTSTLWYRKRVISGAQTGYTNGVIITPYPYLTAGVIGAAQTISYGSTPALLTTTTAPTGGGGGYTYKWYSGTTSSPTTIITGATGTTYQPPALIVNTWYKKSTTDGICSAGYTDISTAAIKITVTIQVASLYTKAITDISGSTATGGGYVTNNGGSAVTARGVCWSTSQNPTIANSKTSNGSGDGDFTSSITGLTSGTTYYVRAYATNGIGTAYGNQLTIVAGVNSDFVSTWDTTNTDTYSTANNQIKLPLVSGGTYDFYVNWGDGNISHITSWNQSATTHTYAAGGVKNLNIYGTIIGWRFMDYDEFPIPSNNDMQKITDISNWGCLRFTNIGKAFNNCASLDITATDAPDLTGITYLGGFFNGCTSLVNANGSIGTWDISDAQDLFAMFQNCVAFNESLNSWDTSNVTSTYSMFGGCQVYNQPLDNWDTSKVTNMAWMFSNCWAFNQDISGWNTSKVTDMSRMFKDCWVFNQPIGAWNTAKVTTMDGMFYQQLAYHSMDFNQSLANWIVSGVTVFNGTPQLPLTWEFMNMNTLSTVNYDNTLVSWAAQSVKTNISVSFADSEYCASTYDRLSLISDKGWVISDGGQSSGCLPCSQPYATGLTATLITGCSIYITWVNGNCVVDYIEIQNFGSWNTIGTVANGVTGFTFTGIPTSNMFRIVTYVAGTAFAGESFIGEIPIAIQSVKKRSVQCGPFDYQTGRIIYNVDNFITGHTYLFQVFRDDLSLYYQKAGCTTPDEFFVDGVPAGCYTAVIFDETCGCSVDVDSYCVQSLPKFSLSGIKKLWIAKWTEDLDYNYWDTADEDYFLEFEDTSFFTSTKIKEYTLITGSTIQWYSLPVAGKVATLGQRLDKVPQGYIFTDTLTFAVSKADAAKWTQMQTLINPENKWITIVEDSNGFYWTSGYRHGAKITAYKFDIGARDADNGYVLSIAAQSENKLLTNIDSQYIINNIL